MSKFKVGQPVVVATTGERVFIDNRPCEYSEAGEKLFACIRNGGVIEWFKESALTTESDAESFTIISPHYTTDSTGKDYLQRFFENSTPEEVKGAMVFTIGKYIDRLGKKDAPEKELGKIIDYATRYRDFLNK